MEEALYYFRANVLYRNYQIEGAADRTLIYLTFFSQQCLKEMEKHPGKKEGALCIACVVLAHLDPNPRSFGWTWPLYNPE